MSQIKHRVNDRRSDVYLTSNILKEAEFSVINNLSVNLVHALSDHVPYLLLWNSRGLWDAALCGVFSYLSRRRHRVSRSKSYRCLLSIEASRIIATHFFYINLQGPFGWQVTDVTVSRQLVFKLWIVLRQKACQYREFPKIGGTIVSFFNR